MSPRMQNMGIMEMTNNEFLIENTLKVFQAKDKNLSADKIQRMMCVYRGETAETAELVPDFFLNRNEVAQILGKNNKTVDYYCQKGILNRVYRTDCAKCLGITAKSLEKLSGFSTANLWQTVQAIRNVK